MLGHGDGAARAPPHPPLIPHRPLKSAVVPAEYTAPLQTDSPSHPLPASLTRIHYPLFLLPQAAAGLPSVVSYRTSPVTEARRLACSGVTFSAQPPSTPSTDAAPQAPPQWVARRLALVPFVALPNLVLGREAVPEEVFANATPPRLAARLGAPRGCGRGFRGELPAEEAASTGCLRPGTDRCACSGQDTVKSRLVVSFLSAQALCWRTAPCGSGSGPTSGSLWRGYRRLLPLDSAEPWRRCRRRAAAACSRGYRLLLRAPSSAVGLWPWLPRGGS